MALGSGDPRLLLAAVCSHATLSSPTVASLHATRHSLAAVCSRAMQPQRARPMAVVRDSL